MPALHRHLPATLSVALACLCAGCLTLKKYPDAPPAQLDPAPPKPILTALPPIAAAQGAGEQGRAARPAGRGSSTEGRGVSAARPVSPSAPPAANSPLADLIMGRTPPSPPPPVMPPQTVPSLGKTTPTDYHGLEQAAREARVEGRVSGDTKREAPPPANPGADNPAPIALNHPPAAVTPVLQHSNAPAATARPPTLDTHLLALSFRQIIALQTLLDRQNFSCNCADGKVGSRTHAALRAFQKARGLAVTGEPNAPTLAALGDLGSTFTSYTITADDYAQLTQNPTTWLERSQAARLGYQTILEAVAERGHATQQAIRDLNPQVTVWPDPPAGTTLTIPAVGLAVPLPHAARIRISIGNKLVRAFDGAGQQLAQFPCSIARDPKKREPCEINVAVFAPNPNYTFDPALFADEPESATLQTKLIIPPGPRNPVGSAWVGLSKTGYGMHGTPKPEDIGKTESHGCFRLANWNAQKLLHMVEIGTPVSVEE
jgi:lipoprotein-anchoring transpeptidase ErfK/SrfK